MMADTQEVTRRPGGALAVIGVFALGLICGAALSIASARLMWGHWALVERGAAHPGRMAVVRMTRELDLDAQQEEKVRAVIERTREQVHQLIDQSRTEIRALLRPDQQEKLDRMRPPGRRLRGEGRGHPPAHE